MVSFKYDEEVVDQHNNDETIMFHAKNAYSFLDGGRREAFADEEGDEGCVLVPRAETSTQFNYRKLRTLLSRLIHSY